MLKKVIVTAMVVLILAITLGHCYIPLPYHHTINAIKIDAEGNRIGNIEITLDGTKMSSLFRKNTLLVDVGSIDDVPVFEVDSSQYEQHFNENFLHCQFVIDDISDVIGSIMYEEDITQSNSYNYYVCISNDFDQWLISVSVNDDPKVYYMGSVSGSKSYDQLAEYFARVLPR